MYDINTSNAWVFISHSNKDFEKVRLIRNKLEALGYKPLLFYLKCLEEDAEIFELIKREIAVRDRFILCESTHTQESEWVQKEIEYIKSLHRPLEIINIEEDEKTIEKQIHEFDRNSSLYIWSTDDTFAQMTAEKFIAKSFKVCILPDRFLDDYYYNHYGSPDLVSSGYVDPSKHGYFVLLISRQLSEKETNRINFIASLLKTALHYFRIFIINEEAMKNGELYYDLVNGDGIRPVIIFDRETGNCDYNSAVEAIMDNIAKIDRHHNYSR